MDKLCEERLVREFPMLYREYKREGSCMSWGFTVGQGWFPIVYELSREIEQAAEKFGVTNLVYMVQVKEKFGMGRFAVRVGTEDQREEAGSSLDVASAHIQALCREAENKTKTVCELCAKPGTLIKDGWWRVRCVKCEEEKKCI
jgi:hypothetical protein